MNIKRGSWDPLPPAPPPFPDNRKPILIEIIGDLSCPWCYVSKRRLDLVLASNECQKRYNIRVRSLPLLLNPEYPPAEELKCLQFPPPKPSNFSPEILRIALRVGLGSTNFRANNLARRASTVQGHCLLKFAEMETDNLLIQHMLSERLYNSFLGDGEYPTLPNIIKLARQVGLDASKAKLFLESREEEANVRMESLQYLKQGVQQLPFFILNGKALFAGCQDHKTIMQAFEVAPWISKKKE